MSKKVKEENLILQSPKKLVTDTKYNEESDNSHEQYPTLSLDSLSVPEVNLVEENDIEQKAETEQTKKSVLFKRAKEKLDIYRKNSNNIDYEQNTL